MSDPKNDIFAMWGLWHWRVGLIGSVHRTRSSAKAAAIGPIFIDERDYRRSVGKGRPYKIVQVDVTIAKDRH